MSIDIADETTIIHKLSDKESFTKRNNILSDSR